MKKGSRQLIVLVYKTSEEAPRTPTLLEQVIQSAKSEYTWDQYSCHSKEEYENGTVAREYFKDHIKDWRFIREAQIKGVNWDEVWEHFRDPNEEANRETFMKEHEEAEAKQKAKDDKFNQKFIDLIQDDMTKLIRMIAIVDDQDGMEMNLLSGRAKYDDSYFHLFEYYDKDFKENLEQKYRTLMLKNGIKTVRWEALFN